MPNRKTHDTAGALSGAGYGAYRARNQEPAKLAFAAIGGALGGLAGSKVPDILEPANSPNHRDTCHSVLVSGLIVRHAPGMCKDWEEFWWQEADRLKALRLQTKNSLEEFLCVLGEGVSMLMAGVLPGLCAGYVSHVALDSGSKKSIPLVTRGC